ncbi:MAG: TolC family protein [Thermodesulfobacteriota bacterium]
MQATRPAAAALAAVLFLFCSGCAGTGPYPLEKLKPTPAERAAFTALPEPVPLTPDAGEPAEDAPAGPPRLAPDRVLSLPEAVSLALAGNYRVRMALRGEGIADDGLSMALTQYYPSFEVKGMYHARNNDPGMVSPALGASFITGEKDGYAASFYVNYLLTDFGGRYFRVARTRLDAAVARLAGMDEVRKVTMEVSEAYFNLLLAQGFHQVARDSLALYESQVKVSRDLFDHQMVAKNDVLSAEIGLAEARQALVRAGNNIELARAALNFSLGMSIDGPTRIKDVDDVPELSVTYPQCLLVAIDHRPELARLRAEKKQAEAGLAEAKTEFAPRLVAQGEYTTATDKYLLNKEYAAAGVLLSWDLIAGGKIPAKVRQARRFVEQVEDRAQLTSDSVALEVKSAWLRLKENQENFQVARAAVAQAQENLALFRQQYESTLVSVTDVLAAQALLTKSRFTYLSTLYDYHIALARLESAVGRSLFTETDNPDQRPDNGKSN